MSNFMTALLADLEADAAANMPNLAANIAAARTAPNGSPMVVESFTDAIARVKASTLSDDDSSEPDPTEFEYSDWSDDGAAEVV